MGWFKQEEFEQHFSVKTQPAEVTGCLTTSGLKKLVAVGCVSALFLIVTTVK